VALTDSKPTFTFRQTFRQVVSGVALTDSNLPLPSGRPSGRWCEMWHSQTQTYLYLQADLQTGGVFKEDTLLTHPLNVSKQRREDKQRQGDRQTCVQADTDTEREVWGDLKKA